ncbi:MAG: peptidase domain-containing ABC transporter, partial [Cyanobacteria bacterium P01_C01_bin.73]
MPETKLSTRDILSEVPAFRRLPDPQLQQLADKALPLRYRIGQPMLRRETLPHQIAVIVEGQARLIGYDPQSHSPITLKRLNRGELLGATGLLRGIPCETAIASTEVTCLTIPAQTFLSVLRHSSALQATVRDRCSVTEAFELMGYILQNQAEVSGDLRELANQISDSADVRVLPPGSGLPGLSADRIWVVSSGTLGEYKAGDPLPDNPEATLTAVGDRPVRLIGFESAGSFASPADPGPAIAVNAEIDSVSDPWDDVPYASTTMSEDVVEDGASATEVRTSLDYPHVRGKGPVNGTLACFAMITQHLNVPFRRDVVQRILNNQLARTGLSLQLCGAIADMLGLKTQLVKVPADKVHRLPTPALIPWNEGMAVLYETNQRERVLGIPDIGVVRRTGADFDDVFGDESEVLLLEATAETPRKRFGLSWFIPSLKKYRGVLIEVFIASFFVQLFGLANPLMVQVIIDRVIVQNSIDTLQVLGVFLVVVAIFEAIMSSLRTYLFVDTTNRIDMALGSEIIDHLLRLPLRYFDRRPVGELASRVNELENIRQFLTGTALTVVLDAIFSVLYIVVMLFYSWILTLVALLSIPLFILLTLIVSPIVRRQLRLKAERNAATQSYLVEALSGIQTVKAQNIELKTRWKWQELYARYVSAGFQNVLTSTAAGSTSNFLNKMSALLVLWVGAYLVLQGQLTLGQLIAFRIISGYVTAPLLRLAQIWQNFQETALSLERLSDILDHPQEADEENRNQIPMPAITGQVRYENLSFRFAASGPLQ